jgi:hypothetical protein
MQRLISVFATPHVLVGAILLVASGTYYFSSTIDSRIPVATLNDSPGEQPIKTAQEVRLVVVDSFGLSRRYFVELELPIDPGARIEAILAKLRSDLLNSGGWPSELSVPHAYVHTIDQQLVAVLDFRLADRISLDVKGETNLYRAISETVLNNGLERILVLKDGQPAQTFLGHLAVPSVP